MAAGRGKGDPMAGLLSGLGGIDPNLFNKPTMGQLKNKQQSPAVPPKPVIQAPRPDTIAAVGSPVRSEAGPSDSFSSQRSPAAKANPGRSGECSSYAYALDMPCVYVAVADASCTIVILPRMLVLLLHESEVFCHVHLLTHRSSS